MCTYSLIWMQRNVSPSSSVVSMPIRSAARFSLRAPSSAQCIVKLELIRIAVFTPATATGSSWPSIGNQLGSDSATTRMKK